MRNFTQIASGVDVLPLLLAIQCRPELWMLDTYWKNHPAPTFRAVDSIFLRFPDKPPYEFATEADKATYLASVDQMECFDQPAFAVLPEARPLIFGLMARINGERLGRVLINRLSPGAHIPKHRDCDRQDKYYDRFHIALKTNQNVEFITGAERIYAKDGDVFWFENTEEHEVANHGESDRIHMIVDIKTSRKEI